MNNNEFQRTLEQLEKAGMDRRHFFKLMAMTGLLTVAGTSESKAFSSKAKGKIVIIGGGAAGISMAARLMKWLDEPDVTLIDPSDRQYYQPGFTLIASGVYKPEDVYKKQDTCIPSGVKWIKDSVAAVDPVANEVTTNNNGKLAYDFLVLTPGLQINWNQVEGITRETLGAGNAHCIYDFEGAQKTWNAIQEFSKKGGRGIYTDTYTKHKCGGAPKKICLLTEHYTRQENTRDKVKLDYFTTAHELYDVKFYTPRLEEIYKERNVSVTLNYRVKGIDTAAKKVYFNRVEKVQKEVKDELTGKVSSVEDKIITPFIEEYDFLHFLPPMSAPDFVREAGLGWTEGKLAAESWVMVDKETLVHKTYNNIISLGDVAGIPTSKTSAAIRMQVPLAAKNLISLMEGKEPKEKYDGYAACPIITEYGKVLLCEFDYDKNPKPSFPFTAMDMSHEQWLAWVLKVYILKPMYFYGMLNGIA
nr:FAD/NAD(P)-binding oxidoreductase [uncultured Macellibacteroides sp.]